MDDIDTVRLQHRQQQWRQDDHDAAPFHDHSENQNQADHQKQHEPSMGSHILEEGNECCAFHLARDQESEQRGTSDDEQDRRRSACRHDQNVRQVAPAERPIDIKAHDQSVGHGNHTRFRGRYQAAEDAAKNDDRHQQSGQRRHETAAKLCGAVPLASGMSGSASDDETHGHDGQCHEHSGKRPRQKQLADRSPRDRCVDDEADAGRDHRANGGCRGIDGRGEPFRIPFTFHFGDHSRAHGGRTGDSGPRDHGHQHVGDNNNEREPAVHGANQRQSETRQPLSNPGGVHDLTGQQKERQG